MNIGQYTIHVPSCATHFKKKFNLSHEVISKKYFEGSYFSIVSIDVNLFMEKVNFFGGEGVKYCD